MEKQHELDVGVVDHSQQHQDPQHQGVHHLLAATMEATNPAEHHQAHQMVAPQEEKEEHHHHHTQGLPDDAFSRPDFTTIGLPPPPDDSESTRSFLVRLGHKIGKDENDVIPYILKLEREWLLQRAQLKSLDEDTFVNRLGFPVGLVQAIKDELGVLDPQSPGGLRYKMHNAHEEGEGEEDEEGDEKSSPGPGRKKKRLTLTEWTNKVEQFALNTKHDPSPFRVTSIYQVECYCCGYAVNMNKPGQLYYLKRHVEGVRPDVRVSNHFKNYRRWTQQFHPGTGAIPTDPDMPAAKKLKSDKDEEENEQGVTTEHAIQEGEAQTAEVKDPMELHAQHQDEGEQSLQKALPEHEGQQASQVEGGASYLPMIMEPSRPGHMGFSLPPLTDHYPGSGPQHTHISAMATGAEHVKPH